MRKHLETKTGFRHSFIVMHCSALRLKAVSLGTWTPQPSIWKGFLPRNVLAYCGGRPYMSLPYPIEAQSATLTACVLQQMVHCIVSQVLGICPPFLFHEGTRHGLWVSNCLRPPLYHI